MTGALLATLEWSDGGIRLLVFSATLLPALMLASRRSSYLVDYYLVVVCLNRFVRRLLDWWSGEFDPRPISSLLPLLIGILMLAVSVCQLPRMTVRYRQALGFVLAGLGYAALMGMSYRMAMLYSLAEYMAPVGLVFYGLAIRADQEVLDRWLNTVARLAVVVACYGWVQWATIPPWFAAWIEWSGMWTSMGHPQPFHTSICSTMESRGPFAWFMATAAISMLASPRWRRGVGLVGTIVVISAILPSTVRSAWVILAVGVGTFALLRGGRETGRLIAWGLVAVAPLVALRSQVPHVARLFDRVESIADFRQDGSFQGRVDIAERGIGLVVNAPQGYGLGASGMAGKISGIAGVIGDNGVLEVLTTFGLPGLLLLVAGMSPFLRDAVAIHRRRRGEHAALGLALFSAGMSAMLFANWFTAGSSGLALMVLGAVVAQQDPAASAEKPLRQNARAVRWG